MLRGIAEKKLHQSHRTMNVIIKEDSAYLCNRVSASVQCQLSSKAEEILLSSSQMTFLHPRRRRSRGVMND